MAFDRQGKPPDRFRTTQWSRVLRLGQNDEEEARDALAGLCQDYWKPLYYFARRKGHSEHDAQDLTQGFVMHLLESGTLTRADPQRGRFRTFLLAAFCAFMANRHRAATTQKRGGMAGTLSLDALEGENPGAGLVWSSETPESVYERAWALALLERVMHRLRDIYTNAGRSELYEALQPYLSGTVGRPGYAALGAPLGLTEGAVTAAMHRMRKRYGQLLREEIAATVDGESGVDDELRHLLEILARP